MDDRPFIAAITKPLRTNKMPRPFTAENTIPRAAADTSRAAATSFWFLARSVT